MQIPPVLTHQASGIVGGIRRLADDATAFVEQTTESTHCLVHIGQVFDDMTHSNHIETHATVANLIEVVEKFRAGCIDEFIVKDEIETGEMRTTGFREHTEKAALTAAEIQHSDIVAKPLRERRPLMALISRVNIRQQRDRSRRVILIIGAVKILDLIGRRPRFLEKT